MMHMKASGRKYFMHINFDDDEEEYELWREIFSNAKKTSRFLNYI